MEFNPQTVTLKTMAAQDKGRSQTKRTQKTTKKANNKYVDIKHRVHAAFLELPSYGKLKIDI